MLYISHYNNDNTYSVTDSVSKKVIGHYTEDVLRDTTDIIVGVLRYPTGVVIKVLQPENVSSGLYSIINLIQSSDIKNFAMIVKRLIPPYIFEVAASSTGKYHPACDLGKGGLLRHTILVMREFSDITSIESTKQLFKLTQRQIDLMMVACMMHDSLKSGWQEDYEKSVYTKFNHPLLAASLIRGMVGIILPNEELEFIAHCIESHMGQWNTSKYAENVVLPKPSDKYQWLIHLSDYIVSRKDVNFKFGNKFYVTEDTEIVKISDKK